MPKRGSPPGPRPQCWVSGPDPVTHQQYRAFIQQRNQAQWRGEPWQLTFEQWQDLWFPHWRQRGRGRWDYCMVRRDPSLPWDTANTEVVSRQEHCQRHRARQVLKRLQQRPKGVDYADV